VERPHTGVDATLDAPASAAPATLVPLMPAMYETPLCRLTRPQATLLADSVARALRTVGTSGEWTPFGQNPLRDPHDLRSEFAASRRSPGERSRPIREIHRVTMWPADPGVHHEMEGSRQIDPNPDPRGRMGYGSAFTSASGETIAVGLRIRRIIGRKRAETTVTWTPREGPGFSIVVPTKVPDKGPGIVAVEPTDDSPDTSPDAAETPTIPIGRTIVPRPGIAEALHVYRAVGAAARMRADTVAPDFTTSQDAPGWAGSSPALAAYDDLLAKLVSITDLAPDCWRNRPGRFRVRLHVLNRASERIQDPLILASLGSGGWPKGPVDFDDDSRRVLMDRMPEGWCLREDDSANSVRAYRVDHVETGIFVPDTGSSPVDVMRVMGEIGIDHLPHLKVFEQD
jgi:hypothetical protein